MEVMRRAAALPLLCLAGCSLLFVHGPPTPDDPAQPLDCTSSGVGPVADGAVGILAVVFAGIAVAACPELDCDVTSSRIASTARSISRMSGAIFSPNGVRVMAWDEETAESEGR
jgi:hypothetical protein